MSNYYSTILTNIFIQHFTKSENFLQGKEVMIQWALFLNVILWITMFVNMEQQASTEPKFTFIVVILEKSGFNASVCWNSHYDALTVYLNNAA